jgi:transcriptional regulator with GAF, ATPase, and Fis domain
MSRTSFDLCKILSEDLDPEKIQRKLLKSLLDLQNVERGSIWVKRDNDYLCIEAVGDQSEKVKGVSISSKQPSIVGWVIENAEMTIAEPGKDTRHYKQIEEGISVKSKLILCFPLFLKSGEVYGAIQMIDTSAGGNRLNLNREYLELLQHLVDVGSIAISNSLIYTDQLKENLRLKETLNALRGEDLMIGRSKPFLNVLKVASDYAKADFPVLITGESGTGKELIAREIHRSSTRKEKPFLAQNCSAIPDTLLESELFGYEKGAFTGATKDKTGLFEAANGGPVFLDEIGDMPLNLQARILRVIQNSEIKPVGGTKTRKIDVRIISATNKDLRDAISKQQFREDLFYRLNVLPVHLPPLRERREDIPILLDHFLQKEALKLGVPPKKISQEALKHLVDHPWKGNIRELENFIKHILVVAQGPWIDVNDLFTHFTLGQEEMDVAATAEEPRDGIARDKARHLPESVFTGCTWDDMERAYVNYLLERNRWNISRASKEAGLNRSTFDSRMKRLGIRKYPGPS